MEGFTELQLVQKGFDDLVAERREKRRTSTPDEWRKYNEETREEQIRLQVATQVTGTKVTKITVGPINEKGKLS